MAPSKIMKQKSKYDVGCRWNPKKITENIIKLNKEFNSVERLSGINGIFTSTHYSVLINSVGKSILYLDPPYYVKGGELYQFSFSEEDHEYLKDCLMKTKHPWILSYDECQEVEDLYKDFADINTIDMTYTINTARKKREFIITSKNMS